MIRDCLPPALEWLAPSAPELSTSVLAAPHSGASLLWSNPLLGVCFQPSSTSWVWSKDFLPH